jgi:hypothetical protein
MHLPSLHKWGGRLRADSYRPGSVLLERGRGRGLHLDRSWIRLREGHPRKCPMPTPDISSPLSWRIDVMVMV